MEYILKREIKTESAVVRVFSPVLEEKEKAVRMKLIYAAATDMMKDFKRSEQL